MNYADNFPVTDALMQGWQDNYGLTNRSPAEAARWWVEHMGGHAPAGCVAALGLAIVEIKRLRNDAKPAAYAIHQITDDEGVEEWVDIFTSPDVAREETAAWESVGRGERYEIVPLYRAPPQRKPEQEPVAWSPALTYPDYEQQRVWANGKPRPEDVEYWAKNGNGITCAYTAPPHRKPLTDDEISTLSRDMVKGDRSVNWLCRAIEAALKEKNHE